MDVDQMLRTIKGMVYELSEVFARLGDEVTEKDEDRMMELIHLISVLHDSYEDQVFEEAETITKEIFRQAFGRT